MFSSYRNKLIVAFFLIATIPILFIGLSITSKVHNQVFDEIVQLRAEETAYKSEKIETWVSNNEQALKSLSSNYLLIEQILNNPNNSTGFNENVNSFKNLNNSYKNVYIAMEDGRQYCLKSSGIGQDLRLNEWYVNALNTKDIAWTQLYNDSDTGDLFVTVSMALMDEDGNANGVLAVDLNFQHLLDRIRPVKKGNGESIYIITQNRLISKIIGKDLLNLADDNEKYVSKIDDFLDRINGQHMGNEKIQLDEEYVGVFMTIPSLGWKVLSLNNKSSFISSIDTMKQFIIYTAIIAFILIIFFSMLFSRMFSNSLEKLRDGTLEIQKGNYDYRIEVNRNDEFGQLSSAFNNMALILKESYDKIRRTTNELITNNDQLQEMNIELEASYEQLQETSDQLNESETKYRTLIENMQDIVWVIDMDFKINYINDEVERILKYKKEYFIGRDLKKLSHICTDIDDDEKFIAIISQNKKNVLEFISKDGRTVYLEINFKNIYEGERRIATQGVARDVTKRVLIEKEVLKRNKELSTINNISITLNSTMELKKLLNNVAYDITRMMDISMCTIRILDGEKLSLMACSDEVSYLINQECIHIDDDIMGRAVKTGEIIEFNINNKEFITKYSKDVFESGKVDYVKIFPLKARGNNLGVLTILTKTKLNESNSNILSSLTNQVAVVLENVNLYQGVKDNYIKTIKTLAAAVEAKDTYTEGHSLRVSKYAVMIANHAKLPKKICEEIEVAGILHDIGKIGVSDSILIKPGKLTDKEFKLITKHPMIGSKILKDVGFSEIIMNSIKYHHKRYDSKGYPYDEDIDELPIEACIIGVADAFDAMTSSRSYRRAMDFEAAINELISNKGTQFHPYIVDIMVDIFRNKINVLEEIAMTKIVAS